MKHFTSWLAVALVTLAFLPAQGVGLIVVDEAHWRPHPPEVIPPNWPHPPRPPIRSRPHVFAPLQLELCKATVRIADQVALTTLEQEFRNPNPRRLEGTFLFPVPKGAHLDRFSMEIDGKMVEAELLEADKARKIYEDIVRRARDPALLEYDGQELFKVRIFPIEGHATKRIIVRYTQLLNMDNGLTGYTLPLNPGRYSSTPIRTLSVKVDLKCRQPVKTLYSPTHTVEVNHNGGRNATVGYESTHRTPDSDFSLYFGTDHRDVGMNLMAYRDHDGEGYFLLLASPGVDLADDQVVPRDVAFVLDTSGSMAGRKLVQAQKALRFCVANLNEEDRFEIIRFSTEVDLLFGGLTEATRASRDQATDFVDGLKPLGGTAIDHALEKALTLRALLLPVPGRGGEDAGEASGHDARPFVIIFLTDGLPTVGITSEDRILDNVRDHSDGKVRVFCFGIGTDVNTHLLDKITEHTRASSQYVLPDEDLEMKVSNFYSKIKDPVLANPELRFEGDPRVSRQHPSELPDLFRGEQLVIAGRYIGHGGAAVVLAGTVNGEKRVFEEKVHFPKLDDEHDFIPRLWANRRVGYLLDQIRLHGENSELRDEVTELARHYGIVTPYTAYLILADEDRRLVPAAAQSLQPLRKDGHARARVQSVGVNYGKQVSGDLAVNAARANSTIRSASSLADSSSGLHEAARAMSIAPTLASSSGSTAGRVSQPPPTPLYQLDRQSQFVGGRNFYRNDECWVDSQVQRFPEAKRVKLQFGSDEYFKFAAAHAEARPWLAQGPNVAFVLNGILYEVFE